MPQILLIHSDDPSRSDIRHVCFIEVVVSLFHDAIVVNTSAFDPTRSLGMKIDTDVAIIIGYDAFRFYLNHSQKSRSAIFISNLSNAFATEDLNIESIDKFLVLEDGNRNEWPIPFPSDLTTFINPFNILPAPGIIPNCGPLKKVLITIYCKECKITTSVLSKIKIANSCANIFAKTLQIEVVSNILIPISVLDEEVKFTWIQDRSAFCKHVTASLTGNTIAVTDGVHARNACSHQVDVVVVGPRGYGGRVTPQNLGRHLENQFEGRIGGRIDEFIPDDLVLEDIKRWRKMSPDNRTSFLLHLQQALLAEVGHSRDALKRIIIESVNEQLEVEMNFLDCVFKLSTDYQLVKLKSKCIIFDKRIKKNMFEFDLEEYFVLRKFENGIRVSDVLELCSTNEDRQGLIVFIKELHINKILVYKKDAVNGAE